MSDRLPVQIDPVTLARRGGEIHGHVPVAAFQRLTGLLDSDQGRIEVELHFGRDDDRRLNMRGRLRGQVALVCQRCLSGFMQPVDQELDLALVQDEAEAKVLPEAVDAVVIGEARQVHTVDLIEDELILALPVIARCLDEAACKPAIELLDSAALAAGETRSQPSSDPDAAGGNH